MFTHKHHIFSAFILTIFLGTALCQNAYAQKSENNAGSLTNAEEMELQSMFAAPRRIAIIVGINEFDDSNWSRLKFAVKDANDMASVLNDIRYGGFDRVISLTSHDETDRKSILQAIDGLSRYNYSRDDTIVVYFSSHGTLARTKDGELHQYIVTRDTRFDDIPNTAIEVNGLKKQINDLKSQKKVMVFAFCHSGKGKSQLNNNMLTELSDIKAPFFVKPISEVSEATVVLAASAWGETAREDRILKNDVYTHFLIEGIKKNDRNEDGAVTVTEAHDYAKQQTYYVTKGEQRPSMESVILGVDPIVLSGKRVRGGKPVLFDYSDRYANMIVMVDGVKKGTLPLGVALDPGTHNVEVATSEDGPALYKSIFKAGEGEQISLPIILHGYDQGVSFRMGYQGFLTDEVDLRVSKPMIVYGLAYSRPGYFSPRLGFRADFSYGHDEQALDVGPVVALADVTQLTAGVSLLYRHALGEVNWYVGPRLGMINISRDIPANQSDSDHSATFGGLAGLHFQYKQKVSLAIEGSMEHANLEVAGQEKGSVYYTLFGSLSVNF